MSRALLVAYLALRLAQLLAETLLRRANRRYTRHPGRQQEAAGLLRLGREDVERALAYAEDRYRFAQVSDWLRVTAGLVFLTVGGLGWIESWARAAAARASGGPLVMGVAFFLLIGLGASILGLPFALYHTFVIEQKHGFNRQTLRGFFLDRLKGLLLGAALGTPLLLAVLWLMQSGGRFWWLWAWAVTTAFSVLTAWIYPTLLAPVFNRFTPLPEGELKERIVSLAERVGFRARGIYVMDASRRTAHGNAYFTGLFRDKRIVLFDTLVEALAPREAAAVLAHELGHFKLKHVRRQLARSILLTGTMFYFLSLLLPVRAFYEAFGLSGSSSYGALVVFGLWLGIVEFPLQPALNAISRRQEYAADAFALRHAGPAQDLGDALRKLRQRSHGLPLSHPLFSRIYHSHPPLLERLKAMGAL